MLVLEHWGFKGDGAGAKAYLYGSMGGALHSRTSRSIDFFQVLLYLGPFPWLIRVVESDDVHGVPLRYREGEHRSIGPKMHLSIPRLLLTQLR